MKNWAVPQRIPEDGGPAPEELRQHRSALGRTRGASTTPVQVAGPVGADRRRRSGVGERQESVNSGVKLGN